MALQTKTLTANGAKGHHKFTLTVSENSTSVSGNTSSLSFSFVLSPIQTSWNWEQWNTSISYTISINGSSYTGYIPNYDGYSSVTLKSGSLSVGHNSDGSKSISISFGVTDGANQYYTCGNASASGTMTLTTIPRASTISSVANVTLGNQCGVTWTPASSTFKYKIKFSLGSWYYTTDFISPATTSAYTYDKYNISGTTTANDTTIYKQLSSSTSGTMTATLTTYNSSGTQIGSASSKTFTVTIPSNVVPKIEANAITLTPQTYNYLIHGKNKIKVEINKDKCSAGTGSSIKSYTFSGSGISSTTTSTSVTSANNITASATSNTTLTYTVKVTDSRGRTASQSKTITCYAYSTPSFTSFSAYRSNSSGTANNNGTSIKCSFGINFASVNSTNNVTVKILYKNSTEPSYHSTTVLTNSTSKSGSTILNSMDDLSLTYTVYATVTDNYSGKSTSSTITVFGASRILNITSDGTGIGFGKMAEAKECIDSKYQIWTQDSFYTKTNDKGYCVASTTGKTEYGLWKNTENLWVGANATAGIHIDGGTYISAGTDTTGIHVSKLVNGNRSNFYVLDANNYTSYVAPKPTKLYGNTSGTYGGSGTITWSTANASDFVFLEIFYMDNNSVGRKSTRVYLNKESGKTVEISCVEASSTSQRVYIRSSIWTIADRSFTCNRIRYVALGTNQTVTVTDIAGGSNNRIKITGIYGYK